MSYDIKFRRRAIDYWDEGHNKRVTAKVFTVSASTLQSEPHPVKRTMKNYKNFLDSDVSCCPLFMQQDNVRIWRWYNKLDTEISAKWRWYNKLDTEISAKGGTSL